MNIIFQNVNISGNRASKINFKGANQSFFKTPFISSATSEKLALYNGFFPAIEKLIEDWAKQLSAKGKLKKLETLRKELISAMNAFDKERSEDKIINKLNKTLQQFGVTTEDISKKLLQPIGSLPKEWTERIPKQERAKKIPEFLKDLNQAVNNFRKSDDFDNFFELALKKAGIIDEERKITLKKFPDDGKYGIAYQIQGAFNDRYVIKKFKTKYWPIVDNRDFHGNFTELNRYAYWQKYAGLKTQMNRFYFGDVESGYLVSKLIDDATPICNKHVPSEAYGLNSIDTGGGIGETSFNKKRGYQYDVGGMGVIHPCLTRNKEYQAFFKKLFGNLLQDANLAKKVKFNSLSQNKIEKIANQREKLLNERIKLFDAKMNKASSDLKLAFIDYMFDDKPMVNFNAVSAFEREIYFKKLWKNGDNKVKLELIQKLYYLKPENRLNCFETCILDSDDEISAELAKHIGAMRVNCAQEDFVKCYKKLAINAPEKQKIMLIDSIQYISDLNERLFCFKLLAQDASIDFKEKLTNKVYKELFDKDKSIECIKILAQNADNQTLKNLNYIIVRLNLGIATYPTTPIYPKTGVV